GLKALFKIS
ncbi:Maltodextrin phosphorylase, partial [Haemophilus influenzae]